MNSRIPSFHKFQNTREVIEDIDRDNNLELHLGTTLSIDIAGLFTILCWITINATKNKNKTHLMSTPKQLFYGAITSELRRFRMLNFQQLLLIRYFNSLTENISWRDVSSPIQDEPFLGLLTDGRQKGPLLLRKICHTYPRMVKPVTVVPYLKKIQKIYELHDTLLELCWLQHFSPEITKFY